MRYQIDKEIKKSYHFQHDLLTRAKNPITSEKGDVNREKYRRTF